MTYRLLEKGEKTKEGDEYYSTWSGSWKKMLEIGYIVEADCPIRRELSIERCLQEIDKCFKEEECLSCKVQTNFCYKYVYKDN